MMQAEAMQVPLLNLPPIVQPTYLDAMSTRQRFDLFNAQNPHVFEWIVSAAIADKAQGMTRSSVQYYFTKLRNARGVRTTGQDGYKISNSYSPYYGEEILKAHPELRGFFVLGKRGGDKSTTPIKIDGPPVKRDLKLVDIDNGALFRIVGDSKRRVFRKVGAQWESDDSGAAIQFNVADRESGEKYWLDNERRIEVYK